MKLHSFCLGAFLALMFASTAAHAGPEQEFQSAIASYRSARYSDAYGRLLQLAHRGDADAARIVLFMHQYGPQLYGSYWDMSNEERFAFQELALLAGQRAQQSFNPSWQPRPGSTRKQAKDRKP